VRGNGNDNLGGGEKEKGGLFEHRRKKGLIIAVYPVAVIVLQIDAIQTVEKLPFHATKLASTGADGTIRKIDNPVMHAVLLSALRL